MSIPRGAPGWSTLIICVFCFLVGWRLNPPAVAPSVPHKQDHQPATQSNPEQLHQQQDQQRKLVELNAQQQQTITLHSKQRHAQPQAPSPPMFSGAEEALNNAGVLDGYQPIPPGDAGMSSFYAQPQQLISMHPRAYHWPQFINPDQAATLITLGISRLRPSQLVLGEGDSEENHKGVRTSEGAFFSPDEHPLLRAIAEKISSLTGIPMSHGEPFNLLRYELGQHYDQHYDYLPEELYGEVRNNRMATVLLYLEAPEQGGETILPLEGVDGLERLQNGAVDYKHCDVGYKYKPQSGDALLFYSMHPNGTFDRHSLHGGCPVEKGRKFVMTRWCECMNVCFCHAEACNLYLLSPEEGVPGCESTA